MSVVSDNLGLIGTLVGTLFGGVGLEITRNYLSKAQTRKSTDREYREELRLDMTSLKAEITELKAENDKIEREMMEWIDKFWVLKEKHIILNGLYQEALRGIRETVDVVEADAERASNGDPDVGPV